MADYKYEFDNTKAGDGRYDRTEYGVIQEALKLLEAKISAWNRVAMENGALEPPYAREAKDLRNMIEWGKKDCPRVRIWSLCPVFPLEALAT